jgi:hypothetical protein
MSAALPVDTNRAASSDHLADGFRHGGRTLPIAHAWARNHRYCARYPVCA